MFKPNKNTVLQQVVLTDFKNAVKDLAVENPDISHFVEGNVLFKTLPHRTSIKEISESCKVVINRKLPTSNLRAKTHTALFTDVTSNITMFTELTSLKEAIQNISLIQEKLGSTFYGALLVSGDSKIKINPLHPLTAMSLINSSATQRWKLMIFTYSDRAKLDEYYGTATADKELIIKNIAAQINAYTSRAEFGSKVVKVQATHSNAVTVTTKSRKHPEEDPEFELLLVAHQLLTDGIVAPYYGTSLIKMTPTNTTGLNVTPMLSANIKQDTSYSEHKEYDSNDGPTRPKIKYNSVCTGSLNNKTLEGLRSLTHSNTLSPYNRDTIISGALAFADECNKRSLEMYRISGMITRKELNVQPTLIEKQEADDNSTKTETSDQGSNGQIEPGNNSNESILDPGNTESIGALSL